MMSKEHYSPNKRLKNTAENEDASPGKDSDKLIEVKKKDTAEDKKNEFLLHEKPFDEQMNKSFSDLRKNHMDEEAD